MKALQKVTPTDEQLKLLVRPQAGTMVIRGAAGSGKTTTALMMLNLALGYLIDKYSDQRKEITLRVFTFNKTLAAYIDEFVSNEMNLIEQDSNVFINSEVTTISKYMWNRISPDTKIVELKDQRFLINNFIRENDFEYSFIIDEVEYLLGRLDANNLESYIDMERTGRGQTPRVEKTLRRKILDDIVYPFIKNKTSDNLFDWNDVAIRFSKEVFESIDIAIIDEAQDLSANQIKAITNQLTEESFSIIVLDTNQRIYKRGFSWKEVGIDKPRFSRLELNYRNSYEIAYFASKLIENSSITFDDDGTLPLIKENKVSGEKPVIVNSYFNEQLNYAINYIRNNIDLDNESIGFLHVKGGKWFSGIKDRLEREGLEYDEITAQRSWPKNDHNIALSTIHSAKGLEFDYVFILGLEERLFNLASKGFQDSDYSPAIKLISMGITRAKKQVILGYKEESKPFFIDFFEKDSFIEV